MTLRNEIFEGLAAAQATKNLLEGNPQDEYYRMRTEALKRQNQIDKEDRDELIRNRQQAQRGVGGLGRAVPVYSSTATPGTNTAVGYQTQDSGQQGFNTGAPPTATGVTQGLPSLQIRKGGSVKKPVRKKKSKAIATGYRAGGPVTPPDQSEPGDEEYDIIRQPYRPSRGDRPVVQRGPHEVMQGEVTPEERERDWPRDDTEREEDQGEGRYEGEEDQPDKPEPRYKWGPNYQHGVRAQRLERGGSPESYGGQSRPSDAGEGGEIAAQARAEAETEQDQLIKEIIAARTGDAYLSTGAARQPPGADTDDAGLTANAKEPPDAMRDFNRSTPRPQDQPISDKEAIDIGSPNYGRPMAPQPKSSRYKDWAQRGVSEESANARQSQEEWNARMKERRKTRAAANTEVNAATPGMFEELTPEQQRELQVRREAAEKVATSTAPPDIVYPQREEELRALKPDAPRPPGSPVEPTTNLPVRPSGTAAAAQAPAPAQAAVDPNAPMPGEDRKSNMLYPRPPAPTAPAGPATTVAAPYNAEQNLGPLPAQNAPPRPPPTSRSTTANGPNPGGGSNGPGTGAGAQPAPPGSLSDPNRTKAFNPETERGIGAVDASGRDIRGINTGAPPVVGAGGPRLGQPGGRADLPYDPQGSNQGLSTGYANDDIHQTLAGARSLVAVGADGKPVIGQGHVSRPLFQQYVQMHSQGGTLTPGDAMLRGMMSDYRTLLKQGRLEQANRMAAGVVQAANLEAASHGDVAVDQARAGNMQGSVQSIVKGLDYLPDGMKHTVSPDGRYMITSDPRTGKVTGQTPIDGRFVLAAAMGLKDGTLMWNTLNAAAASLNKDKDPAGRALSHDIKRAQLEGLILRNNRARTKGTGGGGVATNFVDSQVRGLLGDNAPQTSREAPAGPSADDMAYSAGLDRDPDQAGAGGG